MIIHKNPISVEVGSIVPEDKKGYEGVFIVNQDSRLGKKVLEHMPFFSLVLDDDGNLIDVEPTEKPPKLEPEPTELELLQQENKLLKLSLAESIEKQGNDKTMNQLALADLTEKLTSKGVI